MLIIRQGYLKKKLLPFFRDELANKSYLRVYIFALVVLMVEQRLLGKLFLKQTFGPFIKSVYQSKTAGAVLLKMLLQHMPSALFLFDDQSKEEFYQDAPDALDEDDTPSDEEPAHDPEHEPKSGLLGGFLSRKKKPDPGSEHSIQFFVKFILKCLKVCDEKRKLEALLRVDLVMRKLAKRHLQERVFIQLAGFLKVGNSPEVTLRVLGVLRRWMSRFGPELRRRVMGRKLEEFLSHETLNNVHVYEELFALWEAMELEATTHSQMTEQEYREYVRVLEILLVQKKIGEALAEKVCQKLHSVLSLVKNKNAGLLVEQRPADSGPPKREPILSMFVNYRLTDYEVGLLDGQEEKKAEPLSQSGADVMDLDLLDQPGGTVSTERKATTADRSKKNTEISIKFKSKHVPSQNEDILDLTNFAKNVGSVGQKPSAKSRKKRPKNPLKGSGLKFRKKAKRSHQPSDADLLDFSLPNDKKIAQEFDMDKLKNELSLFDQHKKKKEDQLIDSFFNSNSNQVTGSKSRDLPESAPNDDDKLQKYFSKTNTQNLDDFI